MEQHELQLYEASPVIHFDASKLDSGGAVAAADTATSFLDPDAREAAMRRVGRAKAAFPRNTLLPDERAAAGEAGRVTRWDL